MCVLIFSASFVWNISHSKNNSGRYDHHHVLVNPSANLPILHLYAHPYTYLPTYLPVSSFRSRSLTIITAVPGSAPQTHIHVFVFR
jgi:hypothetical protein